MSSIRFLLVGCAGMAAARNEQFLHQTGAQQASTPSKYDYLTTKEGWHHVVGTLDDGEKITLQRFVLNCSIVLFLFASAFYLALAWCADVTKIANAAFEDDYSDAYQWYWNTSTWDISEWVSMYTKVYGKCVMGFVLLLFVGSIISMLMALACPHIGVSPVVAFVTVLLVLGAMLWWNFSES